MNGELAGVGVLRFRFKDLRNFLSLPHRSLVTSDSLQTSARYTSSYVDTIKVSHSSTERLEREEIEEGDETLNEGIESQ